ncbi:MAG: DMT family transporter [Flavobacteriales bacterium]|jgi:drug/metabolite transporter (DMT)-like permease|nr:DMT family transporter [Flavobacteriales bacterium]MBK6549849.1 DMT family transporter [Flavobacteriales bacterium]MBK6883461.1 DMT family transporter [Flavobacteriales bacterium]MBK7102366.1 DMT family transporter [Flavobacteriales bacterium]MBK7113106.1 DMT family transporter [Flavobacteriales bacterium]
MQTTTDRRTVWILLLGLAFIWGSSFILMKRGLFHDGVPVLTAFQVATSRLAIAWLVLSPVLFRHGGLLRKNWLPLLGTGFLGNGVPAFLFATAQSRIDSSLSGMLNSLTPLMTLLAGVLLFGIRVRVIQLVGILLGLAGAIGLILVKRGDGLPAWSLYAVLPILGAVCYGISGNIVKRYLYALPPTATSALALTFVGPICIVLALGSGLPETLRTVPHAWSALGYVALLASLSSAFAFVLWNVLLQKTTALHASSVTYLMPVVAIGWGILDGEHVGLPQMAMILAVLSGVYLVNSSKRGT